MTMNRSTPSRSVQTLDHLSIGQSAFVREVAPPDYAPEWQHWLAEIGFIPGEQVTLMVRGALGGDPLVVRVGQSTFALRKAEASCITVSPEPIHSLDDHRPIKQSA